jgi:hypothetical protein
LAVIFALVILTSVLFPFVPSDLQASARASGNCERYGIQFDDSSIMALYLHPEDVLASPAVFWARDSAYQVVREYYKARGLPIPLEEWQTRLAQVASLPLEERQQELPYRVARALMTGREAFCEMAAPHVLSFLPPGADLGTTIYITALTDAYVPYKHPAMAVDTSASAHIVYTGLLSLPPQLLRNPAAFRGDPMAQGSATTIYNTLVRELFHAGYWRNTPQPAGVPDPLQKALTTLQNEGIAIYVAHEAEATFPAPLESDYRDRRTTVQVQIERLNALFAEARSLSSNEFRARLADEGIGQKALYNAGGYMAMTIDRELGREALVETIARGPEWFVQAYNSVAEEGMKIRCGGAPTVVMPAISPSEPSPVAALPEPDPVTGTELGAADRAEQEAGTPNWALFR